MLGENTNQSDIVRPECRPRAAILFFRLPHLSCGKTRFPEARCTPLSPVGSKGGAAKASLGHFLFDTGKPGGKYPHSDASPTRDGTDRGSRPRSCSLPCQPRRSNFLPRTR